MTTDQAHPSHTDFMTQAIAEARKAALNGEVPVGAVAVRNNQIIAAAHNQVEATPSSLAHAEILVIEACSKRLNQWRLSDVSIYTTLEPCAMCAGALIRARIKLVVYGASDPKAGALGSIINLFEVPEWNHHPEVLAGIEAEACSLMLSDFFKAKRLKQPIPVSHLPLKSEDAEAPPTNKHKAPHKES